MTDVAIFFFRPWLGGGTTTFTAHLFKALEAAGAKPCIYRVKERGEQKTRPFAKYGGVVYRNVTVQEAKKIVKTMPNVMGSPAGTKYLVYPELIKDLMKIGMRIVMHDPNEFTIYDHLGRAAKLPTRPICIRPTIKQFYKNAHWIPQPYMRTIPPIEPLVDRTKHAISVARIASVKRPKIILEANRLLPKKLRVKLMGAEYRMYTLQLEKKYGDVFQQSGKTFQYPMTFHDPVAICADAKFNVDMTFFPNDGGGTQYALMEAMDAGCVNIMHNDWLRYPGELKSGKHLLTVSGKEDLASTLRNPDYDTCERVVEGGYALLKRHAPKLVGKLYLEELNR